jgi:hypothetical protein
MRHTGQISKAYTVCFENRLSPLPSTDSLRYFLKKARGKYAPYVFIKGSRKMELEFKNSYTRTIQLYGKSFHFMNGPGQNTWYSFKDPLTARQWQSYIHRAFENCKEE